MSAMLHTENGAGRRHHVVVIGSGFGGLTAAKALKNAPVDVTMIASTQHHLFQPLLYQVATGILSRARSLPPPVGYFATSATRRCCWVTWWRSTWPDATWFQSCSGKRYQTAYDSLIVAAGAAQSYFGNDHFAEFAPGMKTIDDALEVRGRLINARTARSRQAVCRGPLIRLPDAAIGVPRLRAAAQAARAALRGPSCVRLSAWWSLTPRVWL